LPLDDPRRKNRLDGNVALFRTETAVQTRVTCIRRACSVGGVGARFTVPRKSETVFLCDAGADSVLLQSDSL